MTEATQNQVRKPYMVLKPPRGMQAVNVREVWQFRDLLMTLAGRDVKLRYRQTLLGAAWVVLQPLMAAGIFTVVFGRVAKLPSDGLPYFLFSYTGLLAWNAFSSTLSKSSGCLVQHQNLVQKVFFPRLVLPLSTVFSTLIDFAVGLGMMVVLLVVYRVMPEPGILLLPVWIGLVLALAVGIGLYASALTVSYRDVQYVMPVVVQMLLYASPVAYGLAAVPDNLRFIFSLNPLTGLLEAFRWSVLGTGTVSLGAVAYSALFAIGAFLLGAFAFRQMEDRFADVI